MATWSWRTTAPRCCGRRGPKATRAFTSSSWTTAICRCAPPPRSIGAPTPAGADVRASLLGAGQLFDDAGGVVLVADDERATFGVDEVVLPRLGDRQHDQVTGGGAGRVDADEAGPRDFRTLEHELV